MNSTSPIYTASISVSNTDGEVDMVVRKAIPAGIDGPIDNAVVTDLKGAEEYLQADGYTLDAAGWQFLNCYDGLRLEIKLER